MDSAYQPKRTLSVKEAASWLGAGISEQMVYKLFSHGQLEGYRVGDRICIYADGIEAFKQANTNKKPARPEALTPRTRPARKRTPTETQGLKFFRL
jgi:excisionase family DNA binding protein